jgi:hypothetical protein
LGGIIASDIQTEGVNTKKELDEMQTVEQIKVEVTKLNKSQRDTLRARFWGGLTSLNVAKLGCYTEVKFEQETGRKGRVLLGNRGKNYHTELNF